MRVYIAGDHAAFDMKEFSKVELENLGFEVVDLGCFSKDRVDYPDFAHDLANKVLNDDGSKGVLICGTGIGISIAANRHAKIRCALCHDKETATLAREHNDANVLAYGARINSKESISEMLNAFFSTEFSGGRHTNRVAKIELGDKNE
ncbi:ribose 5-phosphate isomerase B [Campylobacter corcagiensis]|uniref:Ribose 5-phosphate isomerase B n=1 Tax=Campylobacter corcagiensis TaxID=1448857 RepID=A0A7M1LHB9_9BACT|nr:ribose 5-phosphate isomerase B [Campylobacter corcagiensis]QKF64947.1 allose-6-phosphate isomerase / ribose-5-phosphate isomerase B [Campylobacter corcagiensis]QOQ86895.1 ribose 5-phosphate isomerase B [Campylobacter corcagiensis]